MKTDDLVALLAADTTPVARRAAGVQLAFPLVVGLCVAAVAMQTTLGARPDLALAVAWPMFWVKVLVPAALAAAGFLVLSRLARPGVAVRNTGWLFVALPVLLLWVMALVAYTEAPPAQRSAMVWGRTWRVCTVNIVLISVPVLVSALLALKRLAPTRLALAGACAGVLSGAGAAAVYAFHCPETALPFMAVWYVCGIAISGLAGALLGPWVLRW